MGNYNADEVPDLARAQIVLRNYQFVKSDPSKMETWTLDSANRVCSFRDGIGRQKFKVKYDPHDVDLC